MSERQPRDHRWAGPLWATLVSAASLVRGLPLFIAAAPRTPLRVLGIVALDTLHVLRYSRRLPPQRVRDLALFLDLEGCANAAWDRKGLRAGYYHALREQLAAAGLARCIEEYLSRLRELESRRPSIGGDDRHFDEVRCYREAVARLSIETAAAIALDDFRDGLPRAASCDIDIDTLFRILMQCQVIDDVLDYTEDLSAGLPSFLTASASLPQSMALTASAARHYAGRGAASPGRPVFPLRTVLVIVTALTKLVIAFAGPRRRSLQLLGLDGARELQA